MAEERDPELDTLISQSDLTFNDLASVLDRALERETENIRVDIADLQNAIKRLSAKYDSLSALLQRNTAKYYIQGDKAAYNVRITKEPVEKPIETN